MKSEPLEEASPPGDREIGPSLKTNALVKSPPADVNFLSIYIHGTQFSSFLKFT